MVSFHVERATASARAKSKLAREESFQLSADIVGFASDSSTAEVHFAAMSRAEETVNGGHSHDIIIIIIMPDCNLLRTISY